MTVLVLSHMFPNECDSSAGVFVLEQVKALQALGIKVIAISPVPWAPHWLKIWRRARKYLPIQKRSSVNGVLVERPRVLTLPKDRILAFSGFLFYLVCRAPLARLQRENPIDLIHAHSIVPDGFAAVLLGREFHIPVVCAVHGSDIRINPFQNRLVRYATVWALRRVDCLVGVSSDLGKRALSLAGPRQFTVIYNGADNAMFNAIDRGEARRKLGLNPAGKIVCFIGYLRYEKALEYLLEAFATLKLTDTRLCIVGDGPLKASLLDRARNLHIDSSCLFVGARPHEEIPLWLSAADCMSLCSISEGMPTILPEALLCRVPVVATPVGGISEIIHDRATGLLVPVRDSPAIARALISLLSDRELSSQIIANAEAFARSSLTWEVNAQKTLAQYREVLREHQWTGGAGNRLSRTTFRQPLS